jgi:uncharacterized membrane protein
MPAIGHLHPIIIHFAIGLLIVGVLARVVAVFPFAKRLDFLGPMAITLLILGTAAAVLAVKSGLDAHGPVERIPGVRNMVVEHEEWGIRTRNIFLVVVGLELVALVVALRWRGAAHGVRIASALVGIAGAVALYEAGEHGGDIVYSYAGGVGLRTGDTTDIRRLLVAGLYENLQLDRKNGNTVAAARLTDELQALRPDDPSVKALAVESALKDQKDSQRALAILASWEVPADNQRMRLQKGLLTADALVAAGMKDSARVTLEALRTQFPQSAKRIDDAIKKL